MPPFIVLCEIFVIRVFKLYGDFSNFYIPVPPTQICAVQFAGHEPHVVLSPENMTSLNRDEL